MSTSDVDAVNPVAQSYDNDPYQSLPFANTAPVHLAAIRHLFGLTGAPTAGASVLELGAASGGNLIPMAIHYPQMQFLGVDLSARQVALGQEHIAALELDNIALANLDLQRIEQNLGKFDFIICHGVYSWVSEAVQAAILRICRENLSNNGIALLSYNTYPGWRQREVLRDAMLFHAGNFAEHKVEHGMGMLEFMCELGDSDSLYIKSVSEQMANIKATRRDYILHEYLAIDNRPLYFADFHKQLVANELAYVGDSSFATMYANNFTAEQRERLLNGANGSQIALEQYCDFINNRCFRSSIICKREQEQQIVRQFGDEQMAALQLNALLIELEQQEANEKYQARFSWGDRELLTTTASSYFAAKLLAKSYPRLLKIGYLHDVVAGHLGDKFNSSEFYELFRKLLTNGISAPLMDVNVEYQLNSVEKLGERPCLRPIWQKFYQRFGYLVDACNHIVSLDEVGRLLLPLLDGTRDIDALHACLHAKIATGELEFYATPENRKLSKIEEQAAAVVEHSKRALKDLAANGFMLA